MSPPAKTFLQAPPPRFRQAGQVAWARLCETPAFTQRRKRNTSAQKEGLRYERKAHETFSRDFEDEYIEGPWFRFASFGDDRARVCQPDALIISPGLGRITLLEYKLQHTCDAWWQTQLLYLPVLAHAFPPDLWEIATCEVVKWYDPSIVLPEPTRLIPHIGLAKVGAFNVHIWKPRKAYELTGDE